MLNVQLGALQEGLKVLRDNGKIFKCYDDIWDTIWHAEVGSSGAILDAGYTIDSLMLRYQGVNWTDTRNWGCNAGYVHSFGDQRVEFE